MRIAAICILVTLYSDISSQDASFIYQQTVNSTVTIETDMGLGSGFFVDENIIATCYHVMEDASFAYCYPNNSNFRYEIERVIAIDEGKDLILLKVDGLSGSAINLSELQVSPGERVYVIGSPKGLSATISDGIVSQVRNYDGFELIQITAPISPGSSGGPVMNSTGDLIGVSFAQFSEGQNLNFAIPTEYLRDLITKCGIGYSFDPTYSEYNKYYQDYGSEYNSYYLNNDESNNIGDNDMHESPEIIESYNNVIIIDTKGDVPTVGEGCYIYYEDGSDIIPVAIGTVVNVASSKCTVELTYSTEYLSTNVHFIIAFDKDFK